MDSVIRLLLRVVILLAFFRSLLIKKHERYQFMLPGMTSNLLVNNKVYLFCNATRKVRQNLGHVTISLRTGSKMEVTAVLDIISVMEAVRRHTKNTATCQRNSKVETGNYEIYI